MKAHLAILAALAPFTAATALSRHNMDVLHSAEAILHNVENSPSSSNNAMHTTDDGLELLTHIVLYSEVYGNLTFADEVIWASHDVEPTIWRLYRDCREDYYNHRGLQLQALDPFDREIWWNVNWDRVIVGGSNYMGSRFQIRIGSNDKKNKNEAITGHKDLGDGDDEDKWMYITNSNSCVWFNKEGMSRIGTLSACHPIKFKQLDEEELPTLKNPLDSCS